MKYLNLPKPHGFLIWRGKQTAIASPTLLATGEKMLIVSDGEPYGEAILTQPVAVNLSGLEDMQEYHCVRPEDRKLHWPDADKFFVYKFKSWQPYEEFDSTGKRILPRKTIQISGDEAESVDLPEPTTEQKHLLEQAERLPKTLILLDEAVYLEDGKAVYCDGVDCSKLDPVLAATLDIKSADSLPLYRLALVRIPRLAFKQKKSNEEEKAMPYKIVNNHPDCSDDKPYAVINTETDESKGCSASEEMAKEHMAALMANEGKSIKELIAEARKCYDEGMAMPFTGPTTFVELEALEEARHQAYEAQELTFEFQMLSSNIFNSPDIKDKGMALTALANEYSNLVNQAVKSADVGEDEKAEQGGYLVTGEEGNHLPTRKNGKIDHRLMGAAWAALHGGYRGNKYEGPGKAQAIAKLKKLYESEGMDLPSEKGDTEVETDSKVGKRIRQSMKDRLKAAWETIKEVMDWAEPVEEDKALDFSTGYGVAVKQVDGEYWHFAWSTNAFEDREKEIFSTEALEKYVDEAQQKGDMGYFNLWHIGTKEDPGLTDFAEIKWQAVIGRILVEAGPYLNDAKGQAAKAYFTQYPDGDSEVAPEGWGASPEYRYLPEERKTGIYDNIWKTRTSTLPRLAAANIWTKGTTMALSEQQKAAAVKIFGEDLTAKIVRSAEDATKELEEAGVAHKEVTTEVTEVKTEVEVPVAKIANEVVKLIDLTAFGEALTLMGQQLLELQGEMKALKKTEDIKQDTETPRFVWSMVQRASDAKETQVADDDDLKSKKPAETQVTDKSGAAAFFPARG